MFPSNSRASRWRPIRLWPPCCVAIAIFAYSSERQHLSGRWSVIIHTCSSSWPCPIVVYLVWHTHMYRHNHIYSIRVSTTKTYWPKLPSRGRLGHGLELQCSRHNSRTSGLKGIGCSWCDRVRSVITYRYLLKKMSNRVRRATEPIPIIRGLCRGLCEPSPFPPPSFILAQSTLEPVGIGLRGRTRISHGRRCFRRRALISFLCLAEFVFTNNCLYINSIYSYDKFGIRMNVTNTYDVNQCRALGDFESKGTLLTYLTV